jgi:hypothetical protein
MQQPESVPVFIERDSNSTTSQTNSSTEDDNSLKPSSYESSYSNSSTESDPVKCYNKLKRQGSRSSIIVKDGKSSVQSRKTGKILRDLRLIERHLLILLLYKIEPSTWLQHKKHFFILSSAGKPVWTRYIIVFYQ